MARLIPLSMHLKKIHTYTNSHVSHMARGHQKVQIHFHPFNSPARRGAESHLPSLLFFSGQNCISNALNVRKIPDGITRSIHVLSYYTGPGPQCWPSVFVHVAKRRERDKRKEKYCTRVTIYCHQTASLIQSLIIFHKTLLLNTNSILPTILRAKNFGHGCSILFRYPNDIKTFYSSSSLSPIPIFYSFS